MFRPKSNANWRGTIYERETKLHNSCTACKNNNEGFCEKHKVEIYDIGSNYYRFCKHYESTIVDSSTNEKNKRKNTKPSIKNDEEELFSNSRPSSTNKTSDTLYNRNTSGSNNSEFSSKKQVARNKHIKGNSEFTFKSVVLRKLIDNSIITVKFVPQVNPVNKNKSVIEVTRVSYLGKSLRWARVGAQLEFNGCRCLVEEIR